MFKSLKLKIFFALSEMKAKLLRMQGVRVGKSCVLTGRAKFRRYPGSHITLCDNVTLHSNARYNSLIRLPVEIATITPDACIELGEHCGMSGAKIVCANKVTIGRYTIVGPDTIIYDCKEHEYSPEIGWFGRSRVTGKPIKIGDFCYIGMRCIILKGVTIGDHCVISAGTVITRDVPPGHLAQGNPAVYTPLPKHLGGAGE